LRKCARAPIIPAARNFLPPGTKKMMWSEATHNLIGESVPLLCWLILAVFSPPALGKIITPRWSENLFPETKSLSRLILLWGVGVFLLASYWAPVMGWALPSERSVNVIYYPSMALMGVAVILVSLSLATFIWREVRNRRGS
jgi:hypothetical protein